MLQLGSASWASLTGTPNMTAGLGGTPRAFVEAKLGPETS